MRATTTAGPAGSGALPAQAVAAPAGLRWANGSEPPAHRLRGINDLLRNPRQAIYVLDRGPGRSPGLAADGELTSGAGLPVVGYLPPLYPEWLGDRGFGAVHGVRFPYIAGEMAQGIATTRMVAAMARAGMLGFFGAAGLGLPAVEKALDELVRDLGDRPGWGVNLIHTPAEPDREERMVDLLHRFGVRKVSVSAFMDLTPSLVRCAVAGLSQAPDGRVVRRTHVFAKVSRPELAEKFLSPPPADLLRVLVGRGQITEREAALAARLPLASDVTVEADSGGHTDNRPLTVVLPAVLRLREELIRRFGYAEPIRVGAAGGLGDPSGVAAAFGAGADYVVTGTVNQLSEEAGLSDSAKHLLARADLADVGMAPAADMFEYGVTVQVLRRGTLFAARAGLLYEAYVSHSGLDDIPAGLRTRIERDVLRAGFAEAWASTRAYWADRDPGQVARAESDPKHRMALVFRSYLGLSSRWAIDGETGRQADYQIWCGPAIGAFNRWAAGTPLAGPGACSVVQIARNLLEGAAIATRAQQARTFGVPVRRCDLYVPRHLT